MFPLQTDRMDLFCCVQKERNPRVDDSQDKGLLERIVANYYTPFIMKK